MIPTPSRSASLFHALWERLGIPTGLNEPLTVFTGVLLLVLLAYALDVIALKLIKSVIKRIVLKTTSRWDDIFYHKGVFASLAHLVPLIGLQLSTPFLFSDYPFVVRSALMLYKVALVLVVVRLILNTSKALETIGTHENQQRTIAISTFSQLIRVVSVIIGFLVVISILLRIDIKTTLASLGFLSAIIILVFKDTILGFVSGVQLAATKSIKVGDWVTLPGEKVDGVVMEVNLATAKIRNFDMTISTVPTYSLTASTVTNHQPISSLQVRLISRSIHINARSVRFLDQADLADYEQFDLIRDYITARQQEIQAFNQQRAVSKSKLANGRNQTNLGVFRRYVLEYLKQHPEVAQGQTIMVRLLEPTEHGIPMQLYCFANTAEWVRYEGIQSDLFDHVLAAAAEFGLEIFQRPSGLDVNRLLAR